MCLHILEKRHRKDSFTQIVRKRMFFINVAIKYKGVKNFVVVFHEVFLIPNTISTTKTKLGMNETNSKTNEVKKCLYRI